TIREARKLARVWRQECRTTGERGLERGHLAGEQVERVRIDDRRSVPARQYARENRACGVGGAEAWADQDGVRELGDLAVDGRIVRGPRERQRLRRDRLRDRDILGRDEQPNEADTARMRRPRGKDGGPHHR